MNTKPLFLQPAKGKILVIAPFLVILGVTLTSTLSIYSSISQASFSLALGRVQNRIGSQAQLTIGLFLSSLLCILTVLSQQYYVKIIFEFIFGISCSVTYTALLSNIRLLPSVIDSQQFYILFVAYMNLGQVFGPYFLVSSAFLKRCCYYPTGALLIVCCIYSVLITNSNFYKLKFDIAGASISVLAFLTVLYSFFLGGLQFYIPAFCLLLISLSCFVGLYYIERSAVNPLIPLYLIQKPLVSLFFCSILTSTINELIKFLFIQKLPYQSPILIAGFETGLLICSLIGSLFTLLLQKKHLNKFIFLLSNLLIVLNQFLNMFATTFWLRTMNTYLAQINCSVCLTLLPGVIMQLLPVKFNYVASFLITCSGCCGKVIFFYIQGALNYPYMISLIVCLLPVINLLLYYFGAGVQLSEVNKHKYQQSQVRVLENIPIDE
ncbi:Multidrug resistance protein [Spironucleus salmonicida]|uniref:Multidrug resistance protein n=1 Tax=Spironucleus salmonicida TaxID=348837 RepID=V6M1D0_9EUKA|nr:Multidrug resistance protein [Spironucleus salmonicida]|eukprot:EST46989.1 Multidrug resistance protein [Spironucleus salmonicida]